AFRAAIQLPESDRAAYIHLALGSEDPLVRLQAAKAVCAWKGCPDRERWLLAMTRDRVMPIRRQALYAALDAPAERRRAALNAALLDRHASVRHAARFYLRNDTEAANHQPDLRSFYLSAIAHVNPSTRAAAVLGLGECGAPSDAATLASLVSQESAPVAAAAVRAVAALNREQSLDWFVDLLRDHRPAVSREAGRALAPVARTTPAEPLRRILQADQREHCRRAALRVLLRRDAHDAMVDALTAIQTGHPALVRAGTGFIRAAKPWRSANGPSPTQQATVRAIINSMDPPLPDDLRRSVCEFMGIVEG
ncbi:MAG: HEAT repeat domain-containing protein, partial [bacterium]